jgi:hypothetical protein
VDVIRVLVHIDRLVLRGISRADAAAVSAGLQVQLQHLLAAPDAAGPLAAGGNRHRVRAGQVRISQRRGATAMGRAVAGSIVRGVIP